MTHLAETFDEKDLLGYADPAQYIGLDDRLLVQAISRAPNQTLTVTGRVLLVQGVLKPFEFTVSMPDALTLVTFPFQLAQGFLVSLSVRTSETIPCEWWTFVKIGLTRGGGNPLQSFHPLVSGYCGNAFALGYPRDRNQQPTDGAGTLTSTTVPDPDPGAEWTYHCPDFTRVVIVGITATLITSADVAVRQATFLANVAGSGAWQLAASGTQLAGLQTIYNLAPFAAYGGSSALGYAVPLPIGFAMDFNSIVQSETLNIQAADQWAGINVAALEWADWQ